MAVSWQAAIWWEKAANQGKRGTQYNLGICYEKGTGVECDIDRAVSLYTAAAKKGNKNAIAALERLGL